MKHIFALPTNDVRNEDGLFFFQPMPDVQNLALQHSLTNTIPDLLFNLRASATRVMNPIATDSIHKLSAGGHSSAVDWHPVCPRNPFSRPHGYPGSGRKMGKCVFPSSNRCCHMHDSHISADVVCKLQHLHGRRMCTALRSRLKKKHLEGNLAATIPPKRQRLMTPRCRCKVRSSR